MKKGDRMIDVVIYAVVVIVVGFCGFKIMFPNFMKKDDPPPPVIQIQKEPVKVNSFADDLAIAKKETDKHTEILSSMQSRIEYLEKTVQKQNDAIDKQSEIIRIKSMSIADIKGAMGQMNAAINRIHEREDRPPQPITLKFEGALPIDVRSVPPLQRAPTPPTTTPPVKKLNTASVVKGHALFQPSASEAK